MRTATLISIACLGGASMLACGSGDGSTTAGSGGHAGAGNGTGGSSLVNGCDPAKAEDHTADTTLMIAFGGTTPGIAYVPACSKVKAGTTVVFTGDFPTHPLSGGLHGVTDAASPIKETFSGASASFTLATAGTYPFFCEEHYSAGMEGAVFVE